MFCAQCGKEIASDVKFCDNCGAAVAGAGAGGEAAATPRVASAAPAGANRNCEWRHSAITATAL